jgi:hypothetical protein
MKNTLRTALIGLWAVALCTVMAFQTRGTPVPGIILGTETDTGGLVATIPGTLVQVASDGETVFTPFGLTADVSDAIFLDNQVAAGNPWNIDPSVVGWTLNPGTHTWYIAAPSVPENGGEIESLGIWHSPNPWVSGVIGSYIILEADGSLSDTINLFNDANGAVITFNSGNVVPDPASTLALAGLSMGALSLLASRRRKV